MAHRKRQPTSSITDPRGRPCPTTSPCKQKEEQTSRPTTPEQIDQECIDHSGDGDSSSDYVNNTSEEEDYDEGLPEEDEGVTYYIRYCPEDDSYLEGMDCNDGEYASHEVRPVETDECQEAVEEWTESEDQCHDHGSGTEEQIYEDNPEQDLEDHIHSMQTPPPEEEVAEDGGPDGDYYTSETNGNSLRVSPFRGQKGEGEGEDPEEDIDQIVAEIKMSMSMGSISSTAEQSPEELGAETAPVDFKDVPLKADPAPSYPPSSRHEGRPKSLNIPPAARHNSEVPRSFKVRARTPEERQKWAQDQVSNNPEQPRKQQRSDLNGPAENNNIPEQTKKAASFPSFVDVPGPCEPEDLIDGIIFAANYLGSTQLLSERNPSKNIRMMQAQEAVSRVKSSEGDAQTLTEVDLFISTQRIKVLNADTQETMMDNALRTISYIADIGNIVVLMARRRMPRTASQDCIETTPGGQEGKKQYKMICHVFESEDVSTAYRSVYWAGIQRSIPGVPASQWDQPGGPEPEGIQRHHQHAGDVQ
uniref:Amyloid beta precursor protein binding family A member 2 n=1 Tax=Erpetoichthys calabaricus TaxID=27687 RepID=A0A8C4TJQ6_ERPCA